MTSSEFFCAPLISSWFAAEATLLIRKLFGIDAALAATGIRILASVDYKTNRNNLFIVAISIGFGMIPLVSPTFFATLPKSLEPLLNSGIVLAAVVAVLLNAYFNGAQSPGRT
jgi:xanthine/uracil permease